MAGRIDRIVKILRWPENKHTGLVPWFVICRRFLFAPIIYIGMSIAWLGILCGFGYSSAVQFWDARF